MASWSPVSLTVTRSLIVFLCLLPGTTCAKSARKMTARIFSIIGDANVRRNMTGLNVASRDIMKAAHVIDFMGTTPFDQALLEVPPNSTACIIAAMTDSLLMNGDCGTIFASIDPVLNTFFASISAFCNAHQTIEVRFLLILLIDGTLRLTTSAKAFITETSTLRTFCDALFESTAPRLSSF